MNARPRFVLQHLRHQRRDFRGRATNKSTFIHDFKNNYFHHSSSFLQSSGNELILKNNYSPAFPQVAPVLIEKLTKPECFVLRNVTILFLLVTLRLQDSKPSRPINPAETNPPTGIFVKSWSVYCTLHFFRRFFVVCCDLIEKTKAAEQREPFHENLQM